MQRTLSFLALAFTLSLPSLLMAHPSTSRPTSKTISKPTPNTQATSRPLRKLMMWKVRGRYTTHTLLGSIHMVPKGFFPLDPKIERAYKRSKVLVVEADIHNVSFIGATWQIMRYGTYCGLNPFCSESLRDDLSPALLKRLEKELPRFGLTLAAMMRFKPWFVAITLQGQTLQKSGVGKDGIDAYFLRKANAKQQPIKQLESIQGQLSIFDQLPPRLQIQLLKESLEEQKFKQSFQEILGLWKQGDADKLANALAAETKRNPDARLTYNILLDKRNVGMTKKILGYLQQHKQPHFIVVGAAHFVGKNSILDLLQRAGYHAQQITASPTR